MKSTSVAIILTMAAQLMFSSSEALAQAELFHQHSPPSLQTASGMLLGVYANSTPEGLKIVSTIPGYSAEGRLFPGDLLTQATADGLPVFSIRGHDEMEHAKSQIGPNREAAVEFIRPGVGTMYAWVTFQPVGVSTPQPHIHSPQPVQTPQPAFNQPQFSGGGQFAGGGQPGFNPGPFNPNNSGVSPATIGQSPNNVVMKMEQQPGGNPNNFQPRRGNPGGAGPLVNSNNQAPAMAPISPNNFPPLAAGSPFSPNNASPNSVSPRSSNNSSPSFAGQKFKAEFRLESEKPGARLLFKNPGQGGGGNFRQSAAPQFNRSLPNAALQQSSGSPQQFGSVQQQLPGLKGQQRNRAFGR